jgi:hypothetical protein
MLIDLVGELACHFKTLLHNQLRLSKAEFASPPRGASSPISPRFCGIGSRAVQERIDGVLLPRPITLPVGLELAPGNVAQLDR